MKTFYVKSRSKATRSNDLAAPHIIISIHTPGDTVPNVAMNEFTKDVLHMDVTDLDQEPGPTYIGAYGLPKLFSQQHAKIIADFVKKYAGINHIIVHCDMGISRSAGVAAALAKFYNGDDGEFFTSGGMYAQHVYCPNRLIYSTLLGYLMEHEDDYRLGAEENKDGPKLDPRT